MYKRNMIRQLVSTNDYNNKHNYDNKVAKLY